MSENITLVGMLANAAQKFEGRGESARQVAAVIYLAEVAVLVGDLPEFLAHCRSFSQTKKAKKDRKP